MLQKPVSKGCTSTTHRGHAHNLQMKYLGGIRVCLGDALGDTKDLCLGELAGTARGLLDKVRGLGDRCRTGERLEVLGLEGMGKGPEWVTV